MSLTKSDYYFGAFLSYMLNYGVSPILLEKPGETRRVYSLMTEQISCDLFVKYAVQTNPAYKGTQYLWHFNFSKREKEEIKNMKQAGKNMRFVFICSAGVDRDYNKSEIVFANLDEVEACLDLNRKYTGIHG